MSINSVLEPPAGTLAHKEEAGGVEGPAAGGDAQAPTAQAGGPAAAAGFTFSKEDAAELAARRAAEAKLEARLRGWKPLTLWYSFWAVVIAIGSFSSLAAGQVGAFFIGAALCAGSVKYAHYLYNGGRRRVWFFVW